MNVLIARSYTITFDLVFVLLLAATILFVLAAGFFRRLTRPWFVPIGLACLAFATLIEWKWL